MQSTQLNELIPVLQVAISPVILISGAGLLLLSLTNRFGRAVDRTRQIAQQVRQTTEHERPRLAHQVAIIYRRARLIQISINFCAIGVLLAAVLIITLFFTVLMKWDSTVAISFLFICSLGSLIASLITFIMDIHLSLKALKLELERDHL